MSLERYLDQDQGKILKYQQFQYSATTEGKSIQTYVLLKRFVGLQCSTLLIISYTKNTLVLNFHIVGRPQQIFNGETIEECIKLKRGQMSQTTIDFTYTLSNLTSFVSYTNFVSLGFPAFQKLHAIIIYCFCSDFMFKSRYALV